jgi:hypothetical protein
MSLSSAVVPMLVVSFCGLLTCSLLLLVTYCHRRRTLRRLRFEAETEEAPVTDEKQNADEITEDQLREMLRPSAPRKVSAPCLICLHADLSDSLGMKLPCGHSEFCYECGITYCLSSFKTLDCGSRRLSCPLCRVNFDLEEAGDVKPEDLASSSGDSTLDGESVVVDMGEEGSELEGDGTRMDERG